MAEDSVDVAAMVEETEYDKYKKEVWMQTQIDCHNIQKEAGIRHSH